MLARMESAPNDEFLSSVAPDVMKSLAALAFSRNSIIEDIATVQDTRSGLLVFLQTAKEEAKTR
jgi:hypothetical protein